MKYRIIIFDFDGTLADTTTGIVRTFQETFRQMGYPVPDADRIKSTIGLTLKDGFKAGVDGLDDETAEKAAVIYRRIFPDIAIPSTVAFPGIVETLRKLHEEGYLLAVATSRSHHSLETLAEKIGVDKFFFKLYGAEDVTNHKPAPDLVNLILKETGLKPEDALVVGDATYDLLMGKGAGCRVCGVTWGNQSKETLETASPEHIIDSIEELLELI